MTRPEDAVTLLVLAHGAGAGMKHRSMGLTAESLDRVGVASLRFNFPYMNAGRGAPDAKPVIHRAIAEAISAAREIEPTLPIFGGGRSFGGRMTSEACALGLASDLHGIVFYAFPLHPAGKPATERAGHLRQVGVPMLFLQGSNDALAEASLLRTVLAELGGAAKLFEVQGADHSFNVPKSSGQTQATVYETLAGQVRAWMDEVLATTGSKK